MKVSVLDAMALEDTLAEAHGTLGNVRFVHDWDIESAEKAFQRAIQLNPNYADGHFFYSDFLISLNRSDAAMAELDRAMQLDPFNVFYQCFRGWHLLYRERWDDAITELQRVVRTEPNFPAAQQGLWGAYYLKGAHGKALRAGEELLLSHRQTGNRGGPSARRHGVGLPERHEHRCRQTRVARHRHLRRRRACRSPLCPCGREYERAYVARESFRGARARLVHLAVAWDWHGLRSEPRYRDLLRRMNLNG